MEKCLGNMKYEMKFYLWLYWLYQALSLVMAYPVNSIDTSGETWQDGSHYIITSFVAIILMILCVSSCLCCRRQHRASKGFQNTGGDLPQEFKDGSGAVDTIIERGLTSLELEVPRSSSNNRVEFEPLPIERFVPESRLQPQPIKPKPPSPSLFDHEFDDNEETQTPNREWFSPDLHIPRERLKYLREIGRGWFGKVVEGTQDLTSSPNSDDSSLKTRGIVVRILTEDASASEKAWFLGESLPYLKLHHKNLLELFGTCLETDPYLLLFESCPTGDLKTFLKSNNSSEALIKENVPLRMALDISSALGHMHNNGFAHTDLSARNCLVSSNLSAKLGDYGVGVEKYPEDYYVVGDRALPIRWSAPESLVCTDTTIETRAITAKANLWSFAILLYEITSWGERPYDSLSDEQVIEMILSLNFESYLKCEGFTNSDNLVEAMKLCWRINPGEREDLEKIMEILRGKEVENFEERWENLRPNLREPMRSRSLKELRENTDSELWQGVPDEKPSTTPQARFRLGPDEPIKYPPLKSQLAQESGSETEEESWRGRVERGAYTEKVKQKSKSIADLMVLVHIDDDSEAEWSLGPQVAEKPSRRKLSTTLSVGDLPTSGVVEEFDEALRKLRYPINPINSLEKPRNPGESREKGEIIEVTIEQVPKEHSNNEYNSPDFTSTPKFPKKSEIDKNAFVDVELWKNALEFELERKNTGFESINFEEISEKNESLPDLLQITQSAPDTPQSRGDTSVENEDFSNGEDLDPERKRKIDAEEPYEDERKQLSTPDDERSSDSGFRDKESCEEEENNVTCVIYSSQSEIPHSTTEEEQLKILYELDTILDAEYCGSFDDNRPSNTLKMNEDESTDSITSQSTEIIKPDNENLMVNLDSAIAVDNDTNLENCKNSLKESRSFNDGVLSKKLSDNETENDIDDDDSSTVSLKSDNSYVSFNLDEEFVAAIRNELREKLPRAQMSVVESQELRDEDDTSVNAQETDTSSWASNDDEDSSERSGAVDIAIRYNIYGTPLSPIMEERESGVTSEFVVSREDSRDASVASKLSGFSEDVIVIDTRTNKAVLLEGSEHKNDDDHTGNDVSDEESIDSGTNEKKVRGKNRVSSGAPLPSPEEESKWQAQFPIPLQLQDDLMSTSFSTEHEWDSQDDEEEAGEGGGGEDRAEVEDEDNSSSSGEFVWKRYSEESRNEEQEELKNPELGHNIDSKINEEDEDEGEEEEFTPSAWDATLAPHRSALRSPEKTLKTGDQKKNVWFKKQRYHCVYEYPKETSSNECQSQTATTWEPTSYTDWEEMIDEPRMDYQIDYNDTNNIGDDEFFVSSGNRPFQFNAGDGKYVSQFFPGASVGLSQDDDDDDDDADRNEDNQQVQLGELRHTRDKLKLNLPINKGEANSPVQVLNDKKENEEDRTNVEIDETKKETAENSSESSLSKDESIRSIIRSPDNLSDILSNNDNNRIDNDSADEMSEIDASKTDITRNIKKSSGRPLVISQSDKNLIDEINDESSGNDNHDNFCDESITIPSIDNTIETSNFSKNEETLEMRNSK